MYKTVLKPCPFCGGYAGFRFKYSPERENFLLFVKCGSCHSRSGFTFTTENPSSSGFTDEASLECAQKWNRREAQDDGADVISRYGNASQIETVV